jgi:hypothetical protein
MTDLQAKKIDELIAQMTEQYPDLCGNENTVRQSMAFIVSNLEKMDPAAPGAFTVEQYLEAVTKSLPRKEEEPSNMLSRGSSLP